MHMLLAVDISNTNIKFGLYNSETMSQHWIVSTASQRTADEYAMVLHDLLLYSDHRFADIDDIILSSVVPPLTPVFQELALRYCYKEAIVLDYTMDMGLQFLVDNPWEIGTDRIASALAAFHFYGGPAIIIAFSTATTFDVISSEGDFLGGAIAPGLVIYPRSSTSTSIYH
jgi:type III pantothenate kinase